jgi:hypothetical protein
MKYLSTANRLGDGFQITVGTNSIVSSFPFYETLGFTKVAKNAESYNWLLLTDGLIKLLLHQDKFTGIGYFADDMDKRALEMKSNGFKFISYKLKLNQFYEVFKDKNDLLVSLIQQNVNEMYKPEGKSHSNCGKFREIRIITENIESSVDYWTQVGFEVAQENNASKKVTAVEDGLMRIAFYQPGIMDFDFAGHAITYSSKTINQKIINLKSSGINFLKEVKDSSGKITDAVAVSPEGQTFLFTSNIE